MEAVYEWVRNLVFYLILMTMILNFLPDRKYEKYLRLFTGMILVLLVFGPLADLTGLGDRLAGAFERITFQNDVELLKREIADLDGKRLARLADSYREAVETDLRTMAEGIRLECLEVTAVMEENPESGDFGRLSSVSMRVGLAGGGTEETWEEVSLEAGESFGERREAELLRRRNANREIGNLKMRIGEYYGLEEGSIRIVLENE